MVPPPGVAGGGGIPPPGVIGVPSPVVMAHPGVMAAPTTSGIATPPQAMMMGANPAMFETGGKLTIDTNIVIV